MKKNINKNLFFCAFLASSLFFIGGCDKKDIDSDKINEKQVQTIEITNNSTLEDNYKNKSITKTVEISELKNEQIKEIIEDKGRALKNGVYGCISKDGGNYYVFINGVDYWYSNISFNVKDKLLTIKYDTKYEKGLRVKHLSLIQPNNAESFDEVALINNGNKETFKILFNN
ncbi:hypothetical protein LGK97_00530 [Clostridium sp. CS001]|uniref:hypothetical protein n=1 Tax=Clostridium sp. CS001 TaxID=2880648 RepID=UPI001CF4B0ED|nr:hypothetical protein [Clostridium sp. CS001]MCB2288249.1 hypothetical protein [Clostridium sp. CS001]